MIHRIGLAFLRFAFHHFYNTFAFTYDFVSAIVSRGQWRAWTRAAIPFIVGKRVLEIPCGTGNLLLDLRDAGFASTGVDLSTSMLNLTQKKLQHPERNNVESKDAPLIRARAQTLPFAAGVFDSITMTFPPGFVYDPNVFIELRRVLRHDGRLIWVDGGRLLPRDWYGRLLNGALDAVSANAVPLDQSASAVLRNAGFKSRVETIANEFSQVLVIVAEKGAADERSI